MTAVRTDDTQRKEPEMAHGLLLVAVRTDQPDIERRITLILQAARPTHVPPNTTAAVFFKDEDELVADDLDSLRRFFGDEGVDLLNVGSLTVG